MYNLLNLFKTKKNKQLKSTKQSKSQTKKIYGKTNTELCKKYKDKAIRNTPKNWAYNKCIKRNNWERCKNLPPTNSNMYRDFCD